MPKAANEARSTSAPVSSPLSKLSIAEMASLIERLEGDRIALEETRRPAAKTEVIKNCCWSVAHELGMPMATRRAETLHEAVALISVAQRFSERLTDIDTDFEGNTKDTVAALLLSALPIVVQAAEGGIGQLALADVIRLRDSRFAKQKAA